MNIFKRLINALAPATCILCKQSSADILCDYCIQDSPVSSFALPGENLLDLPEVTRGRQPALYSSLYAIGWYEHILAGLIYQLKFSQSHLAAEALARFFSLYILRRLSQIDDLPDLIIPVPLSIRRQINRGYNQAWLITHSLSKEYNLNTAPIIRRTRYTRQQSRLNRIGRDSNVTNAFALTHALEANHVAIVDDVLTSGATVNEITKVILVHAPHTKVSVWCMAIAKFDQKN